MASLGDAYIEVHADTRKVAPEIEKGVKGAAEEVEKSDDFDGIVKAADKAGSRAGDGFGKSFIRDASGRLRDERGKFVAEGEKAGKEAGEKMGDELGRSLEKKTKGKISSLGRTLAPAWIRTIGVWIAAAAPAAIQLAGTLAPAVGILGAIVPAAIGGAAALTVLKLSFGGLSNILKESTTDLAKFNKDLAKLGPNTQFFVKQLVALKPILADFKKTVQDNFFAGLDETFTSGRIAKSLDRLKESFQGLAFVLGDALSTALGNLTSDKNLGRLDGIIASFAGTLFSLGPLLKSITNILLTLGVAAGPLFDKLFVGLAKFADKFSAFLDKAAADGSLKKFFDASLIALDQLGKLAGALLKIVFDLLDAGKKAGGGNTLILFFQELAGIFDELNKSGALTTFFTLTNKFFGAISAIIKPLLPLVSKLVSLFGDELVKVITILTPPLVAITTAIADALIPVLPSLEKAIDSLLPGIALFGKVLADVFREVTPELATVLIDLFESLASTFVDLAPTVKILLPVLGQLVILLVNLLSTQTIASLQTFALVLPAIAKAINLYLVPQLRTLYVILKVLNAVFSEFVIPFVTGFASMAVQEFDALGKIAGKVGDFFVSIGGDIADFFTKTIPKWFSKIGDFFTKLPGRLEAFLKTAIKKAFDAILITVGIGIGATIFVFTKLPGRIVNAIAGLGGKVKDFLGDELSKGYEAFTDLLGKVEDFGRSLPDKIISSLASLGNKIRKVFKDAFDGAVDTVKGAFDKMVSFVKDLPGKIASFAGKLLASGVKLVSGLLSGLSHPGKIVNTISDAVFGFLKDKINYVIDKLNQGIDKVGKYVGGLPHIPRLAKGAIIDHPTLALIGETGKREVVLPTDDVGRARQLLNDSGLSESLGFHGAAPAVSVSVYIGEQELTQIVDTRVSYANSHTARQLAYGTRTP